MRVSPWVSVLCLLLAGCVQGPEAQLLGHWTGGFVPENPQAAKAAYTGFLHLYQSKHLFKMELHGKFQTLTATGDWEYDKDRLALRTKDLQSDQPSDDEIAALKAYFIEVDEVRAELGRETTLKLSPDGGLIGLSIHLGKIPGHLEFRHAARSSYVN